MVPIISKLVRSLRLWYVQWRQGWERSYTLTKARHLYDATHHIHHNDGGRTEAAGVPLPSYLQGRVGGQQALPQVEVASGAGDGTGVEVVVNYVVCKMKRDMFRELMEMMGRVAV